MGELIIGGLVTCEIFQRRNKKNKSFYKKKKDIPSPYLHLSSLGNLLSPCKDNNNNNNNNKNNINNNNGHTCEKLYTLKYCKYLFIQQIIVISYCGNNCQTGYKQLSLCTRCRYSMRAQSQNCLL